MDETTNTEDFLSAEECEELQGEGYPQGKSHYLWHKDKHNHDKWVLYKRNPHDMSATADKDGFNRWVSAVTREHASCWRRWQQRNQTLPEPKIVAASLTFSSELTPDPRKSATIFANEYRDWLINISEVWINDNLEVTVYFWKDETD